MGKITITLNGNKTSITPESSIDTLLVELKLNKELIIVELNQSICPKNTFKTTIIKENDVIEIIRYIGGGRN